jgi:hypothetical protein
MRRLVFALLFLAPNALAQATPSDPPEPRVIYSRVTEIDMDQADVNAPVIRPPLDFTQVAMHKGFNPLIKIRHDFDAEMKASVDEIH